VNIYINLSFSKCKQGIRLRQQQRNISRWGKTSLKRIAPKGHLVHLRPINP